MNNNDNTGQTEMYHKSPKVPEVKHMYTTNIRKRE